MRSQKTSLPDVLILIPGVFEDERGYFMETYHVEKFSALGINNIFVQDNQSRSMQGVLRGLHYQIRHPQGKLVRVIVGEIFDVAVDIRRSSPGFGKWIGVHLSADNKRQLWIPPGFAHGYYVLSEWAEIAYKTTDYYAPQWERTILWNDSDLAIDWPLVRDGSMHLSKKDQNGLPLYQAEVFEEDL